MARKKSSRTATALNLSGQLGDALTRHAGERMRHLFLFLFAVDAACRLVNAAGHSFKPSLMIQEAATHQVDVGLRTSDLTKDVFDEMDASVIQLSSTSFTKIDAAHYCNLGLDPGPWGKLTKCAEALAADDAVELIEAAEVFTGNTVWLPQRVNIGPDRIIDQLHYKLAAAIFADGQPVFSLPRAKTYAAEATKAILAYSVSVGAGLAACCVFYLQAYANKPMEEMAFVIGNNIIAECDARKLSRKDYAAV